MLFELPGLVILCVFYVMYRQKPKTFPPGPFSWPFVGNALKFGLDPHKNIMALRKDYGDIIGMDLGHKRTVFINEYSLIKEAFNSLTLCTRPVVPHYAVPDTGIMRGVAMTSGKPWIEQRRFLFSYLQSSFRNGIPIETLLLRKANELVEHIKEDCSKPISTTNIFNIAVVNSVWSIITGKRHEITDSSFRKILDHALTYMSSTTALGIPLFFPGLSKMFPKLTGYQYFMENLTPVLKYMQSVIDDHKQTYQKEIQRDYIDYYLKKIEETTDESSSFFGKDGEENLLYGLHDMFLGSAETVSTSLRWTVFLLSHNLIIQDKLRNIIGNYYTTKQNNQPSLKDRQNLPFVEALILEVLRFSSVLPIGVFHETAEDVKFHNYLIPKGTMIIANQLGAHFDPKVWGDPENFRPERFLNEDETEVIRHSAFLAFSTGRRVCPGESLARDELFLFTVRLFQSFKVQFDPSAPVPLLKHVLGTIVGPVDHKVIFTIQ